MASPEFNLALYNNEVARLASRLGESLTCLINNPLDEEVVYREWGSKKAFERTLLTYMVVERGIHPDEDVEGAIMVMDELEASIG